MSDFLSKARGCLAGVALGDALGRATEFMTREEIRQQHGWLDHFVLPAGDSHPLGTVTDDTEQTLLIARLLATGEPLTPERVAEALVEWAEKGLSSYLGPSTRRALTQLMQGVSPYETGKGGTTNGAAMRVAPIGIVHAGDVDSAVRDAVAASIPTHNTRNAMQGAAAVACAIAAAMAAEATVESVILGAQEGARRGREFGAWSWATPLDKRIELAVELVARPHRSSRPVGSIDDALESLYDYIGVGLDPAESVATALGLVVAARGDPMTAILAGVNIGGDTDTIAAIAGAICGALHGIDAIDATMVRTVEQVNGLDLHAVAQKLIRHVA